MKASPLLIACAMGCSGPSFDPPSLVESVRILATQADKPYAAPGDVVNMTVLAVDGRSAAPAPMNVLWLPGACIDPAGDAYYACFPAFGRAFRPGTDIDHDLLEGANFSFQMPSDAITAHPRAAGGDAYGIAFVFTIACAGHVEYVPTTVQDGPDAVPFACLDASGARLGADDFVFSYSRVYAFGDRKNANPVVENVTFGGAAVDPTEGITVDHCTKSDIADCSKTPLDVVVPATSQEPDPGNLDADGRVLGEEIYVDYYFTAGKVMSDTVILFDPVAGRLTGTGDDFYPPQAAGAYRLWVVVHDNRGGVTWQEFPLHAK